MDKVDFKKELKDLYKPPKKFVLVDVPEMQFLMVTGHGDPNTAQEYKDAIQALYPVAYALKFMSKKKLEKDYVVPPLEGLWWAENMDSFSEARDKSQWDWTMMIMTPDWITREMFEEALESTRKKKSPASLDKVRLERYHEGLSVQILHVGSYEAETPTLLKLHNEYLPENGLAENGKHHEIYLSDPNRVPLDKLKIVLRQPVRKV